MGPRLGRDSLLWSASPISEHQRTTASEREGRVFTGTLRLEPPDILYQWSILLFYSRLCSKFSPHLIWRWIFGSEDSRWPSTWRAASPSCDSERCNTLCPKHLWPCRSLPPWPCTTHPAWTQKMKQHFCATKILVGKMPLLLQLPTCPWLTCSCVLQDLCAQISSGPNTPFPWQPAARSRSDPSQ